MEQLSAKFYEVKVAYEQTNGDGTEKNVKETYVIDADTFGEAERKTLERLGRYVSGQLDVLAMKIAPYCEVFLEEGRDIYYKARVAFIEIDEKTEKEKRVYSYYLTNADSLEEARKNVEDAFKTSMLDYDVVSVGETQIVDVFIDK